jgi:hypothetical protein
MNNGSDYSFFSNYVEAAERLLPDRPANGYSLPNDLIKGTLSDLFYAIRKQNPENCAG